MFSNVLIGIDGRQGGRDALALAQRLAAPGATLTLGHVCAPFLGRGAAEARVMERAEAERLLEHERELVQFGNDLDLLIVGSRGLGPVGRLAHGSVSRYLSRHVSCPLLVMPRHGTATATATPATAPATAVATAGSRARSPAG